MLSSDGRMSETQFAGTIAYLFSATASYFAWFMSRYTLRRLRLSVLLAAVETALFFDMVFNCRWRLHDMLESEAVTRNLYAQRVGLQLVTLGLLAVLTTVVMVQIIRRLSRRSGAKIAASGAVLSFLFWCVEVISLHATDAVFHYTIHGIMLISAAWIVCSLITGLGILWDTLYVMQSSDASSTPPYIPSQILNKEVGQPPKKDLARSTIIE